MIVAGSVDHQLEEEDTRPRVLAQIVECQLVESLDLLG